MRYKINYDAVLGTHPINTTQMILDTRDMVRAIYYLLEAGEICLTEEGYSRLDNGGKKFFVGVEE